MTSVLGDVLEVDTLMKAFHEAAPEIVIHLAAQPLVQYSYSYPAETYATNVMGTVNILDTIRRSPSVRAAVMVTTDKCYENREWIWGYRENEPLGGHDPYSSSKACAELVVSAYRRSYFQPGATNHQPAAVASARAGNVIGGGDWAADRLVPDMVRAVVAGQPIEIRNPQAIRPWQHVLEPLSGYLTLTEHLWEHGSIFAEAWNFGPEDSDAREVAWLADRFTELWGKSARWSTDGRTYPHEARYLKLDCSKAKALLDWSPKLDLETALDWTIEWYKAYYVNASMKELSIDQIRRFGSLEGL